MLISNFALLFQQNSLYCPERCLAFQCDLTNDDLQTTIQAETVDVATLIFVLSAIHPDKMQQSLENIFKVMLDFCMCQKWDIVSCCGYYSI